MSEIIALSRTKSQSSGLIHREGRTKVPTYPLFVKGEAANVPPKNRKIRIEAVLVERAQPTWKAV